MDRKDYMSEMWKKVDGRKPVVGLIALWDDEKKSIWMLPDYMDALSQVGCIPIIFPYTKKEEEIIQLLDMVDGVLITGGHDVDPGLYGEEKHESVVEISPIRDAMEGILLKLAMEKGKAILGICRGIQYINVALGGTLYQDIPSQLPAAVNHQQKAPYDSPIHEISLIEGSPLSDMVVRELKIEGKTPILAVNSCHHQAVKETAAGLKPMAIAPDGVVEALYKEDYPFLWAVQWHPECSYKVDQVSLAIFDTFARAMKR